MAEYTVIDPKGIRIKSLLLSDIQGIHTLLKKEGCIDSENKFSDEQKAIALSDPSSLDSQSVSEFLYGTLGLCHFSCLCSSLSTWLLEYFVFFLLISYNSII